MTEGRALAILRDLAEILELYSAFEVSKRGAVPGRFLAGARALMDELRSLRLSHRR